MFTGARKKGGNGLAAGCQFFTVKSTAIFLQGSVCDSLRADVNFAHYFVCVFFTKFLRHLFSSRDMCVLYWAFPASRFLA